MARVVWSPAALDEVARIYSYVAASSPVAAARLARALKTAGDSLAQFELRGRLVGGNLRELTVVYPYIIRYRISGDTIRILRVRHGMRQP
ncbi:MAG: type II toxin-antitoxin system RelE/ParE family toxin [Acetobacteraceae bacterium]|nr:type II toxin-antitoxin system RelE/ParE family toxin [Acetobacteraceae bacterium]